MRRELRVVDEYRTVAGNANTARGINVKGRSMYRNVTGSAYAVLRFPRNIDSEAARPRKLDIPRSHNTHVVIESNAVLTLEHDVQIARQPRIDAARTECIRDGCIIQRKGLRSRVVRCRTLAAFDGEIVAGESLAIDIQVVVRRISKCHRRQHRHSKGEC